MCQAARVWGRVYVSSRESVRLCICVKPRECEVVYMCAEVSKLPLLLWLDFEIFLTLWYFLLFFIWLFTWLLVKRLIRLCPHNVLFLYCNLRWTSVVYHAWMSYHCVNLIHVIVTVVTLSRFIILIGFFFNFLAVYIFKIKRIIFHVKTNFDPSFTLYYV